MLLLRSSLILRSIRLWKCNVLLKVICLFKKFLWQEKYWVRAHITPQLWALAELPVPLGFMLEHAVDLSPCIWAVVHECRVLCQFWCPYVPTCNLPGLGGRVTHLLVDCISGGAWCAPTSKTLISLGSVRFFCPGRGATPGWLLLVELENLGWALLYVIRLNV